MRGRRDAARWSHPALPSAQSRIHRPRAASGSGPVPYGVREVACCGAAAPEFRARTQGMRVCGVPLFDIGHDDLAHIVGRTMAIMVECERVRS